MKKTLALVMAVAMCGSMLAACGGSSSAASSAASASAASQAKPVTLNVVTSYGGDDGNRANYEAAYKAYEQATGNTVRVSHSIGDGNEFDALYLTCNARMMAAHHAESNDSHFQGHADSPVSSEIWFG